ncbi:nucleotide exchange factor GrpE [Algoriphagus persicinus]|uniref:nucleotide exchange factor GrpE n=1 Tax=Algoriphagus persicinus TaxID=3108754 RepID=UPI002B3B4AAF|nr:nucleotide exchange factor GrpE [Algoriphagus sp. E1-3-M2]MEB2786626.1 nucleotide exchange factor GrpE [Algoriphagus sp. E1-3-M2]
MNNKEQVDQEMNLKDENIKEDTAEKTTPEVDLDGVEPQAQSEENKLEYEVADLKDKYLRLYSDFENYRKRTAKERLDLISTASEEVLKDLIPVVDDFERAFKASENEVEGSKVRDGNLLIFQKLVRILASKGLKPMEDLIGKPFDPETQEAITQIPAPSEDSKGKVVDVIEKGYVLGDKVVRHAKVVIGA